MRFIIKKWIQNNMKNYEIEINGRTIKNIQYFKLTEEICSIPAFKAIIRNIDEDLFNMITKEIELKSTDSTIFKGKIYETNNKSELTTIKAFPDNKRYDLVPQYKVIGEGTDLKSTHQLISQVEPFNNMKTEKLETQNYFLLQFNETDFMFIVRLAETEKMGVFCSAISEQISISECKANKIVKIEFKDIVQNSEELSIKTGAALHSYNSWNTCTGKIEVKPKISEPDDTTQLLNNINQTSKHIAGECCYQHYSECNNKSEQLLADKDSNATLSSFIQWEGLLKNHGISIGDAIRFPVGHKIKEDMYVYHKELIYNDNKIFTKVKCAVLTGSLPEHIIKAKKDFRQFTIAGQVICVTDPKKQARVKVSLPFHKREGNDTKQYDGVWCKVPQKYGGISQIPKKYGDFIIPKIYDIVYVQLNSEISHPLVLGTINRENSIPEYIKNPEKDMAIIYTKSGFRFIVNENENNECIVSLCLEKDGLVYGLIKISENGIEISAKDEILINGATTISGSLNVKKRKEK